MSASLLEYIKIEPPVPPHAAIIWLHGLGANGHDFEPIAGELNLPDRLPVRFIFPHAPMRGVTINNGIVMRAWYDILDMKFDRKVDTDSIYQSARMVENLLEHEITNGIPSDRIVLAGFSQGGVIALHAGLRYGKQLAGILSLSGYLPTKNRLAEEQSRSNSAVPIMMAHGTYDPVVPYSHGIEAREVLLKYGYRIHWKEYSMEHSVCQEEVADIRAWLLKVLSVQPID
jgi:phospholipase/carboxylesterase